MNTSEEKRERERERERGKKESIEREAKKGEAIKKKK